MNLRALIGVVMVAAAVFTIVRSTDTDPPGQRSRDEIPADAEAIDATEEGIAHGGLAGAKLAIELNSPPAQAYMPPIDLDDADFEFEERVRALSDDAEYDPWLGRAAREIAFQGAVLGESPPEAVLGFILRSSGAPDDSVAQLILQSSADDAGVLDAAIVRALDHLPAGSGRLLVGVGEAATDKTNYERRVVVLIARRDFELEPTPRSLVPGEIWFISGRAPEGFADAHASVLHPDNRIEVLPVSIENRRFRLKVFTGHQEGVIRVSIDGVGHHGPVKLLQLASEIGRPVPREFETLLSPAENFETVEEAERVAFSLLNRDREALGLPALALDPELSAIARSHSEDMRDNAYFGHLSPTTGLAGDRMVAAGYRASAHGENLAFNDSIAEAESSLLESVGHRRNIVATNMELVGIGLARGQGSDDRMAWHLTQLFARKVQALDPVAARLALLEKINAARVEGGRSALRFDKDLCELADMAAHKAIDMDIEEVPGAIASQASALTQSRVAVSVHVFYEMDDLQPDETCLGEKVTRLGMAFARDQDDMQGRTILVLISSE